MPSNYDNAAWFYDRLSRMVYGDTLIKAQVALLPLIPANAKILIAGGGTGWIIEELTKIHSSGLQLTYVEISAKMMALSKKRDAGGNAIIYINAPVEEAALTPDFDVVITSFLFDNFSPVTFNRVFQYLNGLLQVDGLWLNTDFQLTGKWWQKPLLQSMYLFFRLLGCMEARHLANIKPFFIGTGYSIAATENFFGNFIGSTLYKRSI